ncbi:MAG TPA: xanthine dehydrogenase small subunit [Casimicrobiaceae bacterium]|nr:xanthine dehydrogenase small subunit [Casimicrobiaceae bacterium]
MPEPIRLLLNGAPVEVAGLSPQTTLLEWLREHRRLTGTKEGCAEGDCGACTVVVAQRQGDALAWSPVNACIRLLPSLDGTAVFTVEALAGDDGALHPVQQALVECHGSQCGFCTPGFAMSLFGLYKNAPAASRGAVDDALSGNLCRCTGYRPILAAARRMHELPAPDGWRGPGRAADGSPVAGPAEAQLAARLAALARDGGLDYEGGGQRWLAPATEDGVAQARAAHPDATLVAGATDVGLWITKQHRDLGTLISTTAAPDLARIEAGPDGIVIGAGASLAAAFAALDATHPELHEAWVRFASPPIRTSGTLGGNVANGSPIGDSMPVLIALGARVGLRHGAATRTLPLEDFYLGYRRTALAPGEFVARIVVPARPDGLLLRAWKIGKRYDQDISAVFACFALRLVDGRIAQARIGCGGVAPVPARARRTEAVLEGRPWAEPTIAHAAEVLAGEFAPIDDMRASAAYRRTVLGNLLRRLWLDAGARVPTRIALEADG